MSIVPHLLLQVDGERAPDGDPLDDYAHHALIACDRATVRGLLDLMRRTEALDLPGPVLSDVVFRDAAAPSFYEQSGTEMNDERAPLSRIEDEKLIWLMPTTLDEKALFGVQFVRLHVMPDAVWWTARTDYAMAEMYTAEVTRGELYRALLWSVPDEEIPSLLQEIARKEPSLLLDLVEERIILEDLQGNVRRLDRALPPIPAEWFGPLLAAEDDETRRRAIMALGHARSAQPSRRRR